MTDRKSPTGRATIAGPNIQNVNPKTPEFKRLKDAALKHLQGVGGGNATGRVWRWRVPKPNEQPTDSMVNTLSQLEIEWDGCDAGMVFYTAGPDGGPLHVGPGEILCIQLPNKVWTEK